MRLPPPCRVLLLALALPGCATPAAAPAAGALGAAATDPAANSSVAATGGRGMARIAPPPAVTCDPNHLTAWFGAISGYRRDARQTWLRIATDYDTVEQLTLDHHGQADASAQYLLWGERFAAADWRQLETAPGVLVKGMRAVAWICDDGRTAPVVDWQPARD